MKKAVEGIEFRSQESESGAGARTGRPIAGRTCSVRCYRPYWSPDGTALQKSKCLYMWVWEFIAVADQFASCYKLLT